MSGSRWRSPTVPIPEEIDRFDLMIDNWFETHLRGRPAVDRIMYTASAVGDHGLIWLVLAAAQAARRRPDWAPRLLRTATGLGIESALVNGPVKWLFRRTRPVHEGPHPLHLRRPLTSSFPSGHATAAFFGAALLGDDGLAPLYYAIAVIVAASRVHVKIHHASDVIVGILLGIGLGELARRLVPGGDPR
jgi:undecaprenyl-diphosphatase